MQAITESTTGSTIAVMEKSTTNKQLEPRPPAGIFLRIEQALPEESNGIGAHAKKVRDQREREAKGRGEERTSAPVPMGAGRRAAHLVIIRHGSLQTPGGGAAAASVLLQAKAAQAMPRRHQTAAAAGGKNEACGAPAPLSRHAESSLGTATTAPQALGTRSTIEPQEKERKVCAG